MSISFDPQSNSIRVEHTKEEYVKAAQGLGLHLWAGIDDNIGHRISFRHEHAHFTSFLATGLSELQAILFDFKLTLLTTALLDIAGESSRELVVPLLESTPRKALPLNKAATLKAAWDQAISIEGYLLGLGAKKPVGELFKLDTLHQLSEAFNSPLLHFNLPRYRKFLKQVLLTTPPHMLYNPDASSVRVKLEDGANLTLSSRAVMEAYAITIEVVAEYIKAAYTDLNIKRQEAKRIPSRIYTVAIEAILETIVPERRVPITDYLKGQAGADIYWAVALTAYAAMQVPIIEDVEGESIVMGSLKQLNPAMRLANTLQNISNGRLQNPIDTYTDGGKRDVVLNWLNTCHSSMGDYWTIKFYQHIDNAVEAERDEYALGMSMHQMSWAARYNFFHNPYETIADGGLWSELIPCQVRFIRTADNYIIVNGEGAGEQALAQYVNHSAVYILQAMLFADSWDFCWDKVCGFNKSGKIWAMQLALGFYMMRAGKSIETLPSIKIADGYD